MIAKQEKRRNNLEEKIVELDKAWDAFEKAKGSTSSNTDSEKSGNVVILVKLVLEVLTKSNESLEAYSVYTAFLEKKLKTIPKRDNDSKRKK